MWFSHCPLVSSDSLSHFAFPLIISSFLSFWLLSSLGGRKKIGFNGSINLNITNILGVLTFLINEHVLFLHYVYTCCVDSLGFLQIGKVLLFFLIFTPYISVSYLTAMVKTSIIMLSRSGDVSILALLIILEGNIQYFFH